jgi:hypothetical protein
LEGELVTDQDQKRCPGCGQNFTIADIVECRDFEPLGMQFVDPDLELDMFYFNHTDKKCGSTFVVPVKEFIPFVSEPIPQLVLSKTDRCSQHCLTTADLAECNEPCTFAPFRRFFIDMWQRANSQDSEPAHTNVGKT